MGEDAKKYAYWLACIKGCTRRVQKKLFSHYASAKEVYGQDSRQLEKLTGLLPGDVARILEAKKDWDIEKEWQRLMQAQISFTSVEEADYPPRLKQLADAPYGVFYRGKLPLEEEFRVAIVGARMCSEYGRGIAREIARELAANDVSIVSGMARGIDAAGHRGALDSGGDTYAVFGCGADICYPDYHRQLYHDIMGHGGVISEYPPGTKPLPAYFPQRNRLISVLSDVVLIIEAKQKSGSLITADFALEQGRDVYALPGRITDTLSGGCNRLIAQGAGVIVSVEDLLSELSLEVCRKKSGKRDFANSQKKCLEKEERLVYGCLGLVPLGYEQILAKTGYDIRTVSLALSSLQQKGLVEEIYKNQYKISMD